MIEYLDNPCLYNRDSRPYHWTAIANLKHGVNMQEAIPKLIGHRWPVKFTLLQRFNQKWGKEKDSDCHIWFGSSSGKGYGKLRIGHRGGAIAHRLSWEIHYGPVPHGLHVLHKCDRPKCVNPAHLFLGTNLDNVRDCVSKRRQKQPKGEECIKAKLTEKDILEIRAAPKGDERIAKEFCIGKTQVWRIPKRVQWKHVL